MTGSDDEKRETMELWKRRFLCRDIDETRTDGRWWNFSEMIDGYDGHYSVFLMSGRILPAEKCPECKGSGLVNREESGWPINLLKENRP